MVVWLNLQVALSGIEMAHNSGQIQWSAEELDNKLQVRTPTQKRCLLSSHGILLSPGTNTGPNDFLQEVMRDIYHKSIKAANDFGIAMRTPE